jgi:hypothetical protein
MNFQKRHSSAKKPDHAKTFPIITLRSSTSFETQENHARKRTFPPESSGAKLFKQTPSPALCHTSAKLKNSSRSHSVQLTNGTSRFPIPIPRN